MIEIADNVRSVPFLVLAFTTAPPEWWDHLCTHFGKWQIAVGWSTLALIAVALVGLGMCWHGYHRFAAWRSRRRRIRAVWSKDCPWAALSGAPEGMETDPHQARRRHRRRRYNYYRFYLGMVRDL
jgi:hypothetical protein